MLKLVQFLRIGNAGIIELDRPDALNALNIELPISPKPIIVKIFFLIIIIYNKFFK